MTDVLVDLPQAGWYPDAIEPSHVRWWDGSGWTEHTAMTGPIVAQTAAAGIAQALSRREMRERETADEWADPSVGSADTGSVKKAAYVPMSREREAQQAMPARLVRRGSTQTVGVALLLVIPVLIAATQLAADVLLPSVDFHLAVWAIRAALLLATIPLAKADVRSLQKRGYYNTPPILLAPLLPVYLIVRLVKTGRGALVPLLVSVPLVAASALVGLGGLALLPAVSASAASNASATQSGHPALPLSAEQRSAALSETQLEAQVGVYLASTYSAVNGLDCQPFPSDAAGAQSTCAVSLDGKASRMILQVTPDQPYSAFGVVSVEDAVAP